MTDAPLSYQQLTLNVQLRDDATFDNFLVSEPLGPLLAAVRKQCQPDGEPIIYLFGSPECGKSHLLQAACHQRRGDALYLPLEDLKAYAPADVLQGVDAMPLICLDDIDSVMGVEAWELALFDLFNRARDRGSRLLVAGTASPRGIGVELSDLRSRLSWGIVYQIPSPADELCREILVFRAAQRGLQMSPEVANYIMSRAPRALGALLSLLDRLDAASLSEKRRLSVPFVREILDWA